MSFKPMKPSEFDPSKIQFTKFKKLDNGANTMYLNYENKPIHLTTPELDLPFDTKFWNDGTSDATGKWAVRCNIQNNKENTKLLEVLKEMDEKIKQAAVDNGLEWFKKRNMSMEAVDALYNPQIKEDLDPETGEATGKYPPSFNFKVIKRDGNVICKVFGDGKVELNVNNSEADDFVDMNNLLKKGSRVKLLIRCNGIWHANGKFGCTWRAEQMKVKPVENFDDCVFDDSDNEEEIERIDGNFVESDDEASDAEGSDAEVVEDESKKKVRKVRKKQ